MRRRAVGRFEPRATGWLGFASDPEPQDGMREPCSRALAAADDLEARRGAAGESLESLDDADGSERQAEHGDDERRRRARELVADAEPVRRSSRRDARRRRGAGATRVDDPSAPAPAPRRRTRPGPRGVERGRGPTASNAARPSRDGCS